MTKEQTDFDKAEKYFQQAKLIAQELSTMKEYFKEEIADLKKQLAARDADLKLAVEALEFYAKYNTEVFEVERTPENWNKIKILDTGEKAKETLTKLKTHSQEGAK